MVFHTYLLARTVGVPETARNAPSPQVVKTVRIGETKLLTGGNEKRMRIYDLQRPEAEPMITKVPERGAEAYVFA